MEEKEIVDEFDKLQRMQKETEKKIEMFKNKIIEIAKQKNTNILNGNFKKCLIKEFEKVVYPEDKTKLVEIIKNKGLYNLFSSINYFKLSPKILKGEIDKEIIELTKKEKAYRLALVEKV